MKPDTQALEQILARLLDVYGPQHWWPADSPFEIAVGAVLVQRTAWRNAELAVEALKAGDLLEPRRLARADPGTVEALVRPAGFPAAKADYLRSLAKFVVDHGGIDELANLDTHALRSELLAVRGIGPETTDAILLYLFERPVWIADAYAVRILSRIGGSSFDAAQQMRITKPWIEAARVSDLKELHSLLVELGKQNCRTVPLCASCPLMAMCTYRKTRKDSDA